LSIVARIDGSHNLKIAGNLYTQEPSYDDAEQIDDTYQLDDTHQFDEAGEFDLLTTYLFDLTKSSITVTDLRVDEHGNLITPQLTQNNGLGLMRIGSDKKTSIAGTLTENNVF